MDVCWNAERKNEKDFPFAFDLVLMSAGVGKSVMGTNG
jgi:hypothetical protein